jgi:hypothetical protein
MASFQKKRFEKPDEMTSPPKTKVEVVRMSGLTLTRQTFMPGWKWSNDIKPIAGTNTCQMHHIGYCLSGHLAGKLDDGSTMEFGPGDIVDIPPGHEGWVVGNEPVVFLEFECPATSK